MIRLLWGLATGVLKLALVSLVAIAASHWISWRGRTLSDRVQSSLSGIERTGERAAAVVKGGLQELRIEPLESRTGPAKGARPAKKSGESIASAERARLDALMRESGDARD